jgi:hypothetical protein
LHCVPTAFSIPASIPAPIIPNGIERREEACESAQIEEIGFPNRTLLLVRYFKIYITLFFYMYWNLDRAFRLL